jgi:hypothetical protein
VNLQFGGAFTLLGAIEVLEGILGHPASATTGRPVLVMFAIPRPTDPPSRTLVPDVEPAPSEEGLRHTVDRFRSLG